jgi:hypothetical protein
LDGAGQALGAAVPFGWLLSVHVVAFAWLANVLMASHENCHVTVPSGTGIELQLVPETHPLGSVGSHML